MDIINKNRFMTFAIIGLILLNTVLLVLLWINKPSGKMPGDRNAPPPQTNERLNNFIINELSFDDAQQKQFEQLRNDHHSKAEQILSQMKPLRDSLFNYSSELPQDKVSALTSAIGQKQSELERLTYEHFKSLRGICNETQKKKFDEIINEILNQMAPKPPPPRGKP